MSPGQSAVIAGLFLLWQSTTNAAVHELSCPPPDTTTQVINPTSDDNAIFRLQPSAEDSLCTLTEVIRVEEDGTPRIAGVARSFNAGNWQLVAGPYLLDANLECLDDQDFCEVVLPAEGAGRVGNETTYLLTSFTRNLANINWYARFLEMATFGPTQATVDEMRNEGNELMNVAAGWVKDQMNTVEPTLHRSFFRERVSRRFDQSMRIGRPRHPCDMHARWITHAFLATDRNRYMVVETIEKGRQLLSVTSCAPDDDDCDDVPEPRTIIDSKMKFYTDWRQDTTVKVQDGTHRICWRVLEEVGGEILLTYKDEGTGQVYSCRSILGGNRKIILPTYILEDPKYSFHHVDLPQKDKDFLYTKKLRVYENTHHSEGYLIQTPLQDDSDKRAFCKSIPESGLPFGRIYGTFERPDGKGAREMALYDPRLVIDKNTLKDPLPDGGGYTELAGSDCSNVPRTFLNERNCKLSKSDFSCSAFKANARVLLDATNLVRLYALTGRYVYAIKDLRVDEERYREQSPCLPRSRSRWRLIDDATCSTDAPLAAIERMRWYINRQTVNDKNLIDFWTGSTVDCSASRSTMGMKVLIEATEEEPNPRNPGCWENVHQDLFSVYDFTYWTLPNTHPGNAVKAAKGEKNPIKLIAEKGKVSLPFPSWHNMDWWETSKEHFGLLGRLGDSVEYQNLPDSLRFKQVANRFGVAAGKSGKNVVICGSDGEVANDANRKSELFYACTGNNDVSGLATQKKNAWAMIALNAKDQLRQKVAWTLAQLLVVTPNQINEDCGSEIYMNYYDIFVKHAFGNYRDVLKEVSYSPMMAEMLSFLNSKSTWYVWDNSGAIVWPDENFSREMMQLFTMGTFLMNPDGTPKLDEDGNTIATYDNDNIIEFARAWTGFTNQERRGNIELDEWQVNRVDPLQIIPEWRDPFPKRDLNGDYLGDAYPLCVDMPGKPFLRKGATFRLLGSKDFPEMRSYFPNWRIDQLVDRQGEGIKFFKLEKKSKLYKKLCKPHRRTGVCSFKAYVELTKTLKCIGSECQLDDMEVIQVGNVYYEYVRPPCVELSLFDNGRYIKRSWPRRAMCSNAEVAIADAACCSANDRPDRRLGYRMCEFTGETMTFQQNEKRCKRDWFEKNQIWNASTCEWRWLDGGERSQDTRCGTGNGAAWYWTDTPCAVKVKVKNGDAALVHEIDGLSNASANYIDEPIVRNTTFNYFKVNWLDGAYPDVKKNSCAEGACEVFVDEESGDESCMCSFAVEEEPVFSKMPSKAAVLEKLKIGSYQPSVFGTSVYRSTYDKKKKGVFVWFRRGAAEYGSNTIIMVRNEFGKEMYFKNVKSTAKLLGGTGKSYEFRNPPRFMSLSMPTVRDAAYETEALLDHYFHHSNVPPFIAQRFIQRFGNSNPTPDFIERASTAFTTGFYKYDSDTKFGSGEYGDLGAMVACILLDPEMTTAVLDMDPTNGHVKEPLVKLMHLMRAMEFQPNDEEVVLRGLQSIIGQNAHSSPTVFSFFKPEYQPVGVVRHAELTAPEAQVLTTPTIIGMLNGFFSLIELGLNECYGGFGRQAISPWRCDYYGDEERETPKSYGFLRWDNGGNSRTDKVIDRLSTLLTAGRLSADNRAIIKQKYIEAGKGKEGLKVAQQLMVTTPEFHATNVIRKSGEERPELKNPEPSDKEYRAVVYVYLSGGVDSHNVLVPHSGCGKKDLYDEYRKVRGSVALNQHELLTIDASSSNQGCDTFGVNPDIPILKELYDDEDLVFFANAGVLSDPDVTKENYRSKVGTRTALFAHNVQQKEVERVDLFDGGFGKGLLGRMTDVLQKNGHVTGTVSTAGVAEALVGDTPVVILNTDGVTEFQPIPWAVDIEEDAKRLNDLATVSSGLYGETWSNFLFQALGETQLLRDSLNDNSTLVKEEFPNTDIGRQLALTARLIKTRKVRGADKDVFYVTTGGYDTHGHQAPALTQRLTELNNGIAAFVKEMKAEGTWDDLAIVFASEFGRTITANSGDGTDHAWSGNYWMCGGSVKGGKIHGKHPDDITEEGPLNIGRGRLIPTTSWDSIMYGVLRWMGIKSTGAMREVLPNYKAFEGHWLTAEKLFSSPAPACSARGEACEFENDCCNGGGADKCGGKNQCTKA